MAEGVECSASFIKEESAMNRKSLVVVAIAWALSLLGLGVWVRAQDTPKTKFFYLDNQQNVMFAVGDHPDSGGSLTGQLLVRVDGKFVPVVLKAR
jgi:hypothetical protein